ncbi:hypothetical protein VPNG_01985 [Cytospora leucostoma]|uniref:Uncharacterized protein n=1 Tax=Cytospora leucostoma TaxID=1230097 RepID=A0A423XJG4_9PEZI|nr:hypothetical protein VPNG_01985 [Cytospora leucostoma]
MTSAIMMVDGVSGGNGPSAEAFDWGAYDAMDFTLLPQPSSTTSQSCQDGSISTNPTTVQDGSAISASSNSAPHEENARPACTKQLTDLLLDTDKLWERIPLRSTMHIPRSDPHELYLKALTEKATTKYILENLFTVAQQLIDLYPQAVTLISSRDADSAAACDVPDCTHELVLPPSLRDLEEQLPSQGKSARVDAALANLLVSCHVRLQDVLDRVFLLVTSCTRVTLASPDRREPDFDLSEMRVGSFVPQRTAAVLMHMTLLKHLMLTLSDKLALFREAVSSRKISGTVEDLEARVLAMQHESLAGRHARQVQHISTIEEFLVEFDLNKL